MACLAHGRTHLVAHVMRKCSLSNAVQQKCAGWGGAVAMAGWADCRILNWMLSTRG